MNTYLLNSFDLIISLLELFVIKPTFTNSVKTGNQKPFSLPRTAPRLVLPKLLKDLILVELLLLCVKMCKAKDD